MDAQTPIIVAYTFIAFTILILIVWAIIQGLKRKAYEENKKHSVPPILPSKMDLWNIERSGMMTVIDLTQCLNGETDSCYGNNPSSPYAITNFYGVDPTNTNPLIQLGAFRLQPNQALLISGYSPPPCAYWSFTMYLFNDPDLCNGEPLFASVADSVSNYTTNIDFNERWALLTGVNTFVLNELKMSLLPNLYSVEYPYPVQGSQANMVMLERTAIFESPIGEKRFYENTGQRCFLLTYQGSIPFEANITTPTFIPRPIYLNEKTDIPTTDVFNVAAANFLQQVQSVLTSYTYVTDVPVEGFLEEINYDNGYDCINTCTLCNGDSRGTNYTSSQIPGEVSNDEVIVTFGVNHATIGKSVYTNVSIYDGSRDLGIDSIDYFAGTLYYAVIISKNQQILMTLKGHSWQLAPAVPKYYNLPQNVFDVLLIERAYVQIIGVVHPSVSADPSTMIRPKTWLLSQLPQPNLTNQTTTGYLIE
jgi:hypothetical protein